MLLSMSSLSGISTSNSNSEVKTTKSKCGTQDGENENVRASALARVSPHNTYPTRQNTCNATVAKSRSNQATPPGINLSSCAVKSPITTGAIPKTLSIVPSTDKKTKCVNSAYTLVNDRIHFLIKHKIKLLVFMRGLPGCGKTFLAER